MGYGPVKGGVIDAPEGPRSYTIGRVPWPVTTCPIMDVGAGAVAGPPPEDE